MNQTSNGVKLETQRPEETRDERHFRPNVDIVETEQELTILADVPGATADEIDVDFREGLLTIVAPVRERAPEGASPVLSEYRVGPYRRSFRISQHIDAEAISAENRAGVLVLHLPKAAAARRRKIQVVTE